MCGVFACIGQEDNVLTCLTGLKSLEYRGYDSAGIAGLLDGKIFICKEEGKISQLEQKLELTPFKSKVAIGHTRWATCGKVTSTNAHPHIDTYSSLALVHNGIIENFPDLKKHLQESGVIFTTETDTEVMAQLISSYYEGDILKAIARGVKDIEGSFSVSLIHKDYPDEIFCFSRECPLTIGYSKDRSHILISSDVNSFLGEDLEVVFLQDNEIASVKKGSVNFYSNQLELIDKKGRKITSSSLKPSKEGFEHYMLKEIFEQPKSLRLALQNYFPHEKPCFTVEGIDLKKVEHIHIIGCGTSYHAGSVGAYLFEDLANIPTQVHIGSEFRYRKPFLNSKSLVIALSQSGETADTIAAVKLCKEKNAKIVSLCNQENSSLARLSDALFPLYSGPEISVCSTKTFTSHLMILTLFAVKLAEEKVVDIDPNLSIHLKKIPQQVEEILSKLEEIQALSIKYSSFDHFAYIGRGYMYPASQEAALKLKEISYINATAYPSGELKHGPIALLDECFPVVALCQSKSTFEKIRSNALEAKARNAPVLAFVTKGYTVDSLDDHFFLPETIDQLSPILTSVALQVFAYFIAKERNTDIDQPKNLAKSVTVE